jgi:hypothetical protein
VQNEDALKTCTGMVNKYEKQNADFKGNFIINHFDGISIDITSWDQLNVLSKIQT